VPSRDCADEDDLRPQHLGDTGAGALSTAGDRLRHKYIYVIIRDGRRKAGLRRVSNSGIRSILVQSQFSVRLREPAGDDRAEYAFFFGSRISSWLPRSLVLPVEQRPGRRTSEHRRPAMKLTTIEPSSTGGQADLLADPRVGCLSATSGQWLHVRNVAGSAQSGVALSFRRHLTAGLRARDVDFFESIIRENRSVLDLLDYAIRFLESSVWPSTMGFRACTVNASDG